MADAIHSSVVVSEATTRSSSRQAFKESRSERAREFGGQLQMTNAHPGTIVEVTIPASGSAQSGNPVPEGKIPALRTIGDSVMGQASLG